MEWDQAQYDTDLCSRLLFIAGSLTVSINNDDASLEMLWFY